MPIQFDQSFPEWYAAVKFCDLDYFFDAERSYVFATPAGGLCEAIFFASESHRVGFTELGVTASTVWQASVKRAEFITEEHFHNLMEYLRADI